MANTVSEEPVDFKCKIESVCHVETTAFDAQSCANLEEIRQQIKTELKQELQNRDGGRMRSEENNADRRRVVNYEICPHMSTVGDTSEHTTDVNMTVENGFSEEIQVESESICVIEDTFLKIKKGIDLNMSEESEESTSVNYDGDVNSLPEYVNSTNKSGVGVMSLTVGENTDFEWEKLFTPSQTNFPYPEDEKEIERLAAALWERKFRLLGRDLHDIITTCNYASQWKTISEESKKYVFQRMSLLYLAVTRGWRYALVASDPDSGYSKRRLAPENRRRSLRPHKWRRLALQYRPTPIQNNQTGQVLSAVLTQIQNQQTDNAISTGPTKLIQKQQTDQVILTNSTPIQNQVMSTQQ